MSQSSNQSGSGPGNTAARSAAEIVREAFSALPVEQKFSTLFRIELDMLGDAADWLAATASKAVDEVVNLCESRPAAAGSAGTPTS